MSAFAALDTCVPADRLSKEFTLAAVNGDDEKAYKLLNPKGQLAGNKEAFKAEVKRQFRSFLGKKVHHSVSSRGLAEASCQVDYDGIRKFRDHRLLLYFSGTNGDNGTAEVLPMSVEVHFIKGVGWRVHKFAATAF